MIEISQYIIENFYDKLDSLYVSVEDIFFTQSNCGNKKYDEYIPKNTILILQTRKDMSSCDTFFVFGAKNILHGALPVYDADYFKSHARELTKKEKFHIINKYKEIVKNHFDVQIEQANDQIKKIAILG